MNLETHQNVRFREKLSSKESTITELSQALDSKDKELKRSTTRCVKMTEVISSLRRDVDRFKKRCDRADEVRSRAIEKAVDRARKHFKSANTRRIKRLDGRIEDWVRDLVVELVALDGVPTAKVPSVIERVRHSFAPEEIGDEHDDQGDSDGQKQTISDRSVRRILVEAYIKAFLRGAVLFSSAPCQY